MLIKNVLAVDRFENIEEEISNIQKILDKSSTQKRNKSYKKSASSVNVSIDNNFVIFIEFINQRLLSKDTLNFMKICYRKVPKCQIIDVVVFF